MLNIFYLFGYVEPDPVYHAEVCCDILYIHKTYFNFVHSVIGKSWDREKERQIITFHQHDVSGPNRYFRIVEVFSFFD